MKHSTPRTVLIICFLNCLSMRIDKFLKVSRIIKRRTVAKNLCDAGKVEINSKTAKAGDSVDVGDLIKITFGEKQLSVEVLEVDERKKPEELYRAVKA